MAKYLNGRRGGASAERCRVLIVDDDPLVLDLVSQVLARRVTRGPHQVEPAVQYGR